MENLYYLAIIWTGVFLSSYLASRTQLTAVLFYLAFGCVMVNAGLLPEEAPSFIEGFADIGIILIMFALGFEENSSKFVQGIRRAWGIALFGAIGPFLAAYTVAMIFWGDVKLALMCGLAMTATAVSLTMVSLRSEGLHLTDAARGIMTSAVLDDIASLALVAVLVPLATGQVEVSLLQIALVVFKALLFFGIVTLLGLWIFPSSAKIAHGFERILPLLQRLGLRHPFLEKHGYGIPYLERYGIRHLLTLGESGQATLLLSLLALIVGLTAHYFGFHPAVGAYMAGLILKEEYFHEDQAEQTRIYEECKHVIDNVAFIWIGPVFFVNLGTRLIFQTDVILSVIPETLLMTGSVIGIQVLSAALAARFTAGFAWHDSLMIGFGMLGRAELAFVVLDIGYVQNAIFTTGAFYTLMFTAFWMNIAVPLSIRWWKPYFTGEKELILNLGSWRLTLSNPARPS